MKLALQISSWGAVALGALTFFNGMGAEQPTAGYDFLGGILFAGLGTLALIYVHQTQKKLQTK